MLTWNEIRQLANMGVDIGSHGVNHEIHHERQPLSVRKAELLNSKICIEKQIDRECRAFTFPNGNFILSSAEELAEAGYELGFSCEHRIALRSDNRYLLPLHSTPI